MVGALHRWHGHPTGARLLAIVLCCGLVTAEHPDTPTPPRPTPPVPVGGSTASSSAPPETMRLRSDAVFYPGGLPSNVVAGNLPTFVSTIASETRNQDINRLFAGVVNPQNMAFDFDHRNVGGTNGTVSDNGSFLHVDEQTGEVSVFHPTTSVGQNFTVDIFATCVSGPPSNSTAITAAVYSWNYTVSRESLFAATEAAFTLAYNGIQLNESSLPSLLAINESYRFTAPSPDSEQAAARYFTGAQGFVSYSIVLVRFSDTDSGHVSAPDGDILINPETGTVFVSPTCAYNATFAVIAEDETDTTHVTLLRWSFQTRAADMVDPANGPNARPCASGRAVDAVPFDDAFHCNCTGSGYHGANCGLRSPLPQLLVDVEGQYIPLNETAPYSLHNRTMWAIGVTYLIAPISVVNARISTDPPKVANRTVTFSVDWGGETNRPRKFFIDGATGEILVRIPNTVRNLTAQLVASSPGTEPAIVANMSFELRWPDTAMVMNGPNKRDCSSPGQRRDDVEFDGQFTCDCGPVLVGANCFENSQALYRDADDSNNLVEFISVPLVLFALVIFVVVVLYRTARWKAQQPHKFNDIMKQLHDHGLASAREGESSAVPSELARKSLVLLDVIGTGNFGQVSRGLFTTTAGGNNVVVTIDVAVKSFLAVASDAAKAEFLREAAITWHFKHPCVVQMHGVVTSGDPFLLVLEFCANGELKTFLEADTSETTVEQLYSFLVDIASGMSHLAALGFVHRDLATRNVLLDAGLRAKICDFGLGRDTDGSKYYSAGLTSSLVLPLRWSDPTVLETSKFSELTDVWSYGITAIEIFTQGSTPYAGWTHSLVIDRLRGGYRLPRPDTCPVELFDMVIAPCWLPTDGDPGRPTFDALLGRLTEVAGVIKVATQGVMWDSLDLDGTQHHDRPDSSEPTALGDELHASISNPNSLRYEYVSPMDGAVHGPTGLYRATGADQHVVPHPISAPASDVASEDLDLRASTDSGLQTDCTRLPELAVAGSEQRVEVSFYSVGQVSQNSTADPRPRTPPDTLRATLL